MIPDSPTEVVSGWYRVKQARRGDELPLASEQFTVGDAA
jgi:hypothetical protein